jgi:transcription initiation factor TFIID subunit 11
VTAGGAPKKKRGRKAMNAKNADDDQASSLAGGRAATNVSGQGGDKEGEEDEDEDKAEMALEDVVARTQEQKQEEIRLRAMLVEAFDSQQYNRYELWRAAKLADSVVKRVRANLPEIAYGNKLT